MTNATTAGKRFQDAVVIVTGAAQGIGAAIAEAFAAEGARVEALDVKAQALDERVAGWRASGGLAHASACDVTDSASVTAAVQAVLGRWGRVDVLVNNAGGFWAMKATDAIDDAEWDALLRVNLTSAFFCARAVLPAMRRQRAGRIVNVSSVGARGAFRVASHYAAAKAGVLGFTRHLAVEAAPDGITVNAVAPGTVGTERVLALRTPEETARLAAAVPLRRLGEPQDIADAVLFLASDAARWITGATLDVNGGQLMV
jgi:NAD(P)-dependent dehydrogenase (short-subunit alcohol dehydrogenase family)